ncbi:MAG: N-6 DNA methylase [Xanthobacteraceae bacterium]
MARHLKRAANIGLTAVSIEGGLISPDQVAVIAATAPDQKAAAEYGCPKGTNLRDEITRYFRIGQAHWQAYAKLGAPTANQTTAFVKSLLEEAFGFEGLHGPNLHQQDGHTYRITLEAKGGRVPIVVAAPLSEADAFTKALPHLGDEHGGTIPRRSPSVLLQDWLNANTEVLWGLVFAGDRLRLMRDNASFTRPAYIEADLGAIFRDEMFADFTATWLLIQATRFGGQNAAAADCALERWREAGLRAGTAAREKLGANVREALLALGQGFLDANPDLRTELDEDRLSVAGWFEQLLRVVYRLMFLAVAEDRELLHGPGASTASCELYASAYGFGHMRERSARRSAHDHHHDAWEGAKIVFRGLARGEGLLGLPPLGGLFAPGRTPNLDSAKLPNRAFLRAVFHLSWLIEDGRRVRINWRDMATEELGSVYEGLLALVPIRVDSGRRFAFADGDETRGNERKTSGSYYTPDSLVQTLLDSTLDPVLSRAEAEAGADAILKLSVIDPACGSGHFLLGSARRMASRVALLRDSEAPDYPAAMRDVVSHCIYGVDRNPMAVELAKVALWIETVDPGKPLTFLDSNIRCGDSLIGVFDVEMLKKGIPDEAYKPLTGDDKEIAKAYGRYNKQQRDGKGATGLLSELRPPKSLSRADSLLNELPQDDLGQVEAKSRIFTEMRASDEWRHLKSASDLYVSAYLYTAAFFAPKPANALGYDDLPLTEHVWKAAAGREVAAHLTKGAEATSRAIAAFHWHIEFPRIFESGGFDVVIGNPPWERIKLQELEFFASRSPAIANAANKAEREKLIMQLEKAHPESVDGRLWQEFQFAKRTAEAASEFARSSGRYPLTGRGDVNTYALFSEHFARLTKPEGRAGIIVPTGIATDLSTSAFFGDLVAKKRLVQLIDFENRERIFPSVYFRVRFCLLSIGKSSSSRFACMLTDPAQLDDAERRYVLSADDIARINPNTKTSPLFRSRADADLTAKVYGKTPVLIEEREASQGDEVNPWGISFQTMFHMSGDSSLFRAERALIAEGWSRAGHDWIREGKDGEERRVPLYEAKMIHHFNHRYGDFKDAAEKDDADFREIPQADAATLSDPSYEPTPRYWVPADEVSLRAARVPSPLKRWIREGKAEHALKAIAEWLVGYYAIEEVALRESELIRILGAEHAWRSVLGTSPDRFLLDPRTRANGQDAQRETPLTNDDIQFLASGPRDPLDLAIALVRRKQPRWLVGWRDITNATNERTVIACVFPKVGTNHKLPLAYLRSDAQGGAAFVGQLSSLCFDYVARQKLSGTSLTYFYLKQMPVLPPSIFSGDDYSFLVQHMLELTYTSELMRLWAEDLGYSGAPFAWDEGRRTSLRAELEAFYALKFGLGRDELRYVLDPSDTKGAGYPSETFRVLKSREEARFGEYRTRRLVLAAFDQLSTSRLATRPIEVRTPQSVPTIFPDGALARPSQTQPGDVGAVLTAVLKTLDRAVPIRDVRLATALILEPRLLLALLPVDQATEWRRRVGPEAEPLTNNIVAFATRNNVAWGVAVQNHRANGRLIENLQSGTWAPGAGLEAIYTAGWPDGRAAFVVEALKNINLDAAINSLPADVQQWVTNAAAA